MQAYVEAAVAEEARAARLPLGHAPSDASSRPVVRDLLVRVRVDEAHAGQVRRRAGWRWVILCSSLA